jgi:hypothetical protein
MPVSSIGYYQIYDVNLKDKCIWILDLTSGSANKGEWLKRYSHTLKQIEENVIKVMRLKHLNYEVKHLYHCITDNVSSGSR